MSEVIEIQPQVWVVKMDGHQLRQHYFTLQSAMAAARMTK
jgi:hypothetical protein